MLVNNFLVGCDPEFVAQDPPNLIRADGLSHTSSPWNLRDKKYCNSWGLDHNGWVFEPHPLPNKSTRAVVKNMKRSLQGLVPLLENFEWRAGAYVQTPQRPVTLGGHVHIDLPRFSRSQITALNCFTRTLFHLNILPELENRSRREVTEYGRYSDTRSEHGHCEYRTFPSWLYSQRVALLCLTGSKLAVTNPESLLEPFGPNLDEPYFRSKAALKAWFERFKGDDDVDYILEKKHFEGKLEAVPDRELKEAWRLDDDPLVSEKIIKEEWLCQKEKEKEEKLKREEVIAASQTLLERLRNEQMLRWEPNSNLRPSPLARVGGFDDL